MIPYQNIVFPEHLDLRYLGGTLKPDGRTFYKWTDYMLLSEFKCFYTRGEGSGSIVGEAGLIIDRASIPQFFLSVLPKDGSWQRPSVTHDIGFIRKGVPGCETFELTNALMMAGLIGHRNGTEPTIIKTPWFQRNALSLGINSREAHRQWNDDD